MSHATNSTTPIGPPYIYIRHSSSLHINLSLSALKKTQGGLKMGKTTEDEFEETLSLIDLPITPMSDHKSRSEQDGTHLKMKKTEEISDFNFGSLTGSQSTRMEMSSADELFLHGQILPLRLSVDSRTGRPDSASASEFTSSRSSSYSSTSSVQHKPARIRNQFHAHPSPTPRIGFANVTTTTTSCRKSNSSIWDIFRLGPVQTPRIDLKDLRTRNPNNNKAIKTQSFIRKNDQNSASKNATLKQRMFDLGGCTCSVDAVENVQSRIVVLKSAGRRSDDLKESEIDEELKRKMEGFPRRRRTFEWLKQLPDADLVSNIK